MRCCCSASLASIPMRRSLPSAVLRWDEATCEIVKEFKPEVVSFHFGFLEPRLLARVFAGDEQCHLPAGTLALVPQVADAVD